ncbi:unnamed protein product [Miscanthus lutarioriparius]|uniref:Uncharacterized protein n=1 Tax=Miscanthus lutarioriparius TaxID=422564 RepID=A0A811R6G1_9POAL|nr:unnamed protein product [Miscanthus lutarioriparius]
MVCYDGGYAVHMVFDGSKLGIEPQAVQITPAVFDDSKLGIEPYAVKITPAGDLLVLTPSTATSTGSSCRCHHVELQVFRKELDRSESFTVSIPAHTGGAMPASSYLDQSLTEEKHPESWSSSQQVIFDTEGTSSSESSLLGTVASEMKLEELNQKSERCEPAVEKATVELEHGIDCGQAPDQKCDHAPAKAAKAPSKCREADETADTNKEAFGSRPGSMKKTRRRLQPAAAMLLREFTGTDIDADNEMEERCRSSSRSRVPTGRSDALVQLLMKGHLGGPVRRA